MEELDGKSFLCWYCLINYITSKGKGSQRQRKNCATLKTSLLWQLKVKFLNVSTIQFLSYVTTIQFFSLTPSVYEICRPRPLPKPSRFENAVKSEVFWKLCGFRCRVNGKTASIWIKLLFWRKIMFSKIQNGEPRSNLGVSFCWFYYFIVLLSSFSFVTFKNSST